MNIEWDRSVFQVGDATVEIIRERLIDDFYDDYDDFFEKFN